MPADDSPYSATTRVLSVDVPPDRAHAVAAALRELVELVPPHHALVPILDTGVVSGQPFIVIPPITAEPLDVALNVYGPAAMADAVPRLQQLADALDLAARDGLCHGALSAADILVSAEETRLIGVGVATALGRAGVVAPVAASYAAPEVLHGEMPTTRADQFALAVIAYEWLFGTPFVPGASGSDVPALAGVDHVALRRALDQATAMDAADRFPTCSAFVAAVAASIALEPQKVLEFTPPQANPPGRFGAAALLIALLAGVVVGAGVMWLFSRVTSEHAAPGLLPDSDGVSAARSDADSHRPREVTEAVITPPRDDQPIRPSNGQTVDAAPASQLEAGLLVHSIPAGAAVSVDGVMRGHTPLAVRSLDLGTRTVTVTRAGYRPVVRQVQLTNERPSRTLEVTMLRAVAVATPVATSARAEGTLVIDSRPAGALVFVDGRAAGSTPLTLAIPAGAYTVRLEHAGFRTVTTRVEVKPRERARVAARLEGGSDEE